MKLMNGFRYLVGLSMVLTLCAPPVWAVQATATATVNVSIGVIALLSLARDASSSTLGAVNLILFDQLDSQQPPAGGTGDPNLMYAPYRSEAATNWHLVHAIANGTSIVFSMSVTGNVGTQPLTSRLKTFCGGFYEQNVPPGGSTLIPSTQSTNWQFVQGFQRTLDGHHDDIGSFSYQLDVTGVPAGSSASTGAAITYTLVST